MAFGIMGGWNQSQAHAQFVSNVVDHGMNIQAALEAARVTKLTFDGLRRDRGIAGAGRRPPRPRGQGPRDRTARRVLEPGRRRPVREARSCDRRQRRRLRPAQGRRRHPRTGCSDATSRRSPKEPHDTHRFAIRADLRQPSRAVLAATDAALHAETYRFVPTAFYQTFSAAHPVALRIKSGDTVTHDHARGRTWRRQ